MDKVLFSSNREDWETPLDFFKKLNNEFHFVLDAAATAENAKCAFFFSPEQDGLAQSWDVGGNVFCNPPYCRETGKWVKKAYEESKKTTSSIVLLIPARPDVSYFHDYILGKAEIRFIRGRLKFCLNGKSGGTAPFPSMVVVYNPITKKPDVKGMNRT